MRLWTLHPKYLDSKGLVAVWREGLLAQAVLEGKTKGYKNHPQLERFKALKDPVSAIGSYLHEVKEEANSRGYKFNGSKIRKTGTVTGIQTTSGQIDHEWGHLLQKLKVRSKLDYERMIKIKKVDPHPVFQIVPGEKESWEKS